MRMGMRIKLLRTAAEMTQVELAKRVGGTPNHLSQIESGGHNPSLKLLRRIAEELNVGPGRLLDGLPGEFVLEIPEREEERP